MNANKLNTRNFVFWPSRKSWTPRKLQELHRHCTVFMNDSTIFAVCTRYFWDFFERCSVRCSWDWLCVLCRSLKTILISVMSRNLRIRSQTIGSANGFLTMSMDLFISYLTSALVCCSTRVSYFCKPRAKSEQWKLFRNLFRFIQHWYLSHFLPRKGTCFWSQAMTDFTA